MLKSRFLFPSIILMLQETAEIHFKEGFINNKFLFAQPEIIRGMS